MALRSGGWTLSGTTIGRLATAVCTLFAAAALGSRSYGEFALAQSTALTVTSVSGLGLSVAVTKLVAEARVHDRGRAATLIGTALVMTAAVGVATMVGFCLLSPFMARVVFDQQVVATVLIAAAPLLVLGPLAEMFASVLTGLERFPRLGVFRALRGALTGIALCVAALGISVSGVLLAVVSAEAISCVVACSLLVRLRGPFRLTLSEMRRCVRPLLHVSLPAMLAGTSLLPALWLGQVMLSRQPDGLRKVGVFAVAYRWHLVAVFVPAALGSVLLPMLGRLQASNRVVDARRLFVSYGWFTLALAAPACLILLVFARQIMAIQGPQYVTGASMVAILGIAVIPAAMNNVLSQMAVAETRLALWVVSDIALAGVIVFGAWLLVPALDGVGLSWAYVAAYVTTCLVLIPVLLPDRSGSSG
jgi:O-antigen/teichoic acid export membrane protein